jgi:peptidoglycan/LPS O-acetylase OafA/YrhL
MSTDAERPAPIPALTGMRFVAALMVFVSHYGVPGISGVPALVASFGYVGVTFFFILSGFVLTYNHWTGLNEA